MNKTDVIAKLEEGREQFLDAIEGLSEDDLQQPGVMGEWSVKDILVHLARWETELVMLLWQASRGQKPTSALVSSTSVDELNDRWYQESRTRPLSLVLEDFHGVRTQLMRRIEDLPEKAFNDTHYYRWLDNQPLWEWIAGDSFDHEAEHEAQIRAWRAERGV